MLQKDERPFQHIISKKMCGSKTKSLSEVLCSIEHVDQGVCSFQYQVISG